MRDIRGDEDVSRARGNSPLAVTHERKSMWGQAEALCAFSDARYIVAVGLLERYEDGVIIVPGCLKAT